MTITRDGKEIELTNQELCDAYYEAQSNWDADYVIELLENLNEVKEYDNALRKLKEDREFALQVGRRYRKYLMDDTSSDLEYECAEDAYRYMAGELC